MKEVYYKWNGFLIRCWIDWAIAVLPIEILGKGWAYPVEKPGSEKLCKHELWIELSDSEKKVVKEGHILHLFCQKEDVQESEMVACLMLTIYLATMVEEKILPFHAAAISIGEKRVLLLAETGGGKTSVALEMCQRHGAKMISNDFFVGRCVDGRLVEIGNDNESLMSVRRDIYFGRENSVNIPFKGSENRAHFTLAELKIEQESKGEKIDAVLWVELTHKNGNTLRKLTMEESIMRFHYNVTSLLTGVTMMLFDREGNWVQHCPQLIDERKMPFIHKNIEEICACYQPCELIGCLNDVVQYLKINFLQTDFLKNCFHTHTYRCGHAIGSDEDYVKSAIQMNFSKLGFTDHIFYPKEDEYECNSRMMLKDAYGYVASIRSLQKKYKGIIDIYVGFEMDYIPYYYEREMQELERLGIDYLILGQHCIGDELHGIYAGNPTDDENILKQYIDLLIQGIQTNCFSCVAHPDIINFIGDKKIYRREMEKLCRMAKENDVTLELNMHGMHEKRQYPNHDFWKIVSQVGNKVILGVDAHNPESILNKEGYEGCREIVQQFQLNLVFDLNIQKRV